MGRFVLMLWLMTSACGAWAADSAESPPETTPQATAGQSQAAAARSESPSTQRAAQKKTQADAAKSASGTADDKVPYKVEDGSKVDAKTLAGWKTWRALACERCHGAEQEGLVGPPLVESLKVLTKEEFHQVLMNGRPEKGMPPFSTSKMVNENWEGLYAYLKGRSDGKIKPGRLSALEGEE